MQKLIAWVLDNPLIVLILTLALGCYGAYAFVSVNVEAYPDPAPPIIEVIALSPGASAEEMERQVTIPLEVGLAGMPGLNSTRSRSLFGLTQVRCQFDYSVEYEKAKQDCMAACHRLEQASGKEISDAADKCKSSLKEVRSQAKDAEGVLPAE